MGTNDLSGSYAEYAIAPAQTTFHIPNNILFESKQIPFDEAKLFRADTTTMPLASWAYDGVGLYS